MMHLAQTADLTPDWVRKSFAWQQFEKGLAQGREEGREEDARGTLLMLMDARFGTLSKHVREKVNHASLEELRVWMRRLLNASDLDALFV